jgi:putative ABC transport system permease protein
MRWGRIGKKDADLDRELRSDLDLEEEEQRENGASPAEARFAARRAFGNPALIREQTRAIWTWNGFESFTSDVRYGLRGLCRTPLLTFMVVLALSVGMGLNVGIFSILNTMFLEPPTRIDPASFVQIYPRYEGWFAGAAQSSRLNAEDFDAIRTQAHSLRDVAAWEQIGISLDDLHRQDSSLLVTCNYFHVFGMERTLMGRFFLPDECQSGTETRVLVLSEHFWRNRYASDPQIVGKVLHINRQPFVVVGIAADSSANLIPGDVWMPYTLQPAFNHGDSAFQNPNSAWLNAAARLRQGYTRADARAEIETILRQRDRFYLEQRTFTLDRKTSVVLTNGSYIEDPAFQTVAAGLMALVMGPLVLVLLLACTNVTMLFLSRSLVRRGEIAVRLALGAGRGRLTRMLVIESLLAAFLAGIISIGLAIRIPSLVLATLDPQGQFSSAIYPDWKVFGFLACLVLVSAVLSSLAPARESFRFDLVTALKGREGSVTARTPTTDALIVVQLAMSFVLLAAAVLFARMPSTIEGIDPGFETRRLMTVPLEVTVPPYTNTSAIAFHRALEARLLALPGVQSLAWASIAPFRFSPQQEVHLDNQSAGQGHAASVDKVSPNFFSTFSIPLLHGRQFLNSDASAAGPANVAIVSQAFARTFWGAGDPVGKVVVTTDRRRLVVIGVAADTRSERYGIVDGPRLYTLRHSNSVDGELFVRFTDDAAPLARAIEQAVKTLDPTQVETPVTIRDFLETNATQIRALARIVLFMAGIAVVLAITGIYAVLSFVINRRTREFGIQMMLGATRESIFRSVMKRGLKQIAIGLFCGLILAFPAAWSFARMTKRGVLPIHAFDFSVYCIAAIILLVVSICAMALPGLRATRVDPMQALRNE